MTIPVLPVGDAPAPRSLGVRPLGDAPLVLIDPERHAAQIALRRRLLDDDHDARFAALPGTRTAQGAALALVAADLRRQGVALEEPAGLPDPLDWAGRQVVEDLLLLDATDERVPLVAGSLCFPNGWEIRSALGRSFAEIHAPVPGFAEALGGAALALMRRLRPDRPVWRANWTLRTTDALDLSPGVVAAAATRGRRRRLGARRAPDAVAAPRLRGACSSPSTRARGRFPRWPPTRCARGACGPPSAEMPGPMREYKAIGDLAGPVVRYLEARLTTTS